MQTDVATYRCKLLLREKNLNIGISYCSFINFCEIKVCPKTWAYFTLKLGCLKQVDHKTICTYPPLKYSVSQKVALFALAVIGGCNDYETLSVTLLESINELLYDPDLGETDIFFNLEELRRISCYGRNHLHTRLIFLDIFSLLWPLQRN